MATSAPMTTHPCPVPGCNRMTRPDGHCRRPTCPNRVPDEILRPAREQALAEMRETIRTARRTRTQRTEPSDD